MTAADLSSKKVIKLTVEKDGKSEVLEADVVLVSVGRKPLLHGIDAKALGLELQKNGAIKVDDQLRTNLPGVFAIGDVAGGKLLAHKAEEEGVIAAEVIAGKKVHMHYAAIPGVVYTWPEIATVGLTEARSESIRSRLQDRQVPLLRQRPRALPGRDERVRQDHRRRCHRRTARLSHHRSECR